MKSTDAALDAIYDLIDDLMRAGRLDTLDGLLACFRARIGYRSTDEILAYLTATLPARSRLHQRQNLVEAAWRVLQSRGQAELLAGLE